MKKVLLLLSAFSICVFGISIVNPASAEEDILAVSAGISPCVEEIMKSFTATGGQPLSVVKAATGPLAQQIDKGAPYSILVAADPEWPEWLVQRGHGKDPRVCALSCLALWSEKPVNGLEAGDLEPLVIAAPNPEFTSHGKMAMEFLSKLGLWEKGIDNGHVLLCGNAPQCVAAVKSGTAQAALIPLSTATIAGGATREITSVEPTPTVVLLIDRFSSPNAVAFGSFLLGEKAREIWTKWGFGLPRTEQQ
ncbi:MAG: molybdate ABC transporter substrate-binding protein [Thermovirga sp.]